MTDRKKGKFRPRHLLRSRVPHIALCSRIASDRRPTASFSLEVTLGAKTDRFSSRSRTQSRSSLLLAKFRSLLLEFHPSLPSCPWAIYLFPIIIFPHSVTRGGKPTASRRSKVKIVCMGIRSISWEISQSSNRKSKAR